MIIELVMTFKDELSDATDGTSDIIYTLNAPDGFEVTGGQLFVENPNSRELQRFSFRIDRDSETGKSKLTILEDVKS